MSTPILRQNQGSPITATYSVLGTTLASTTTSGTYSSATRVQNTANALLMDAWLKGSFSVSPAGAGSLQLWGIARDSLGNIGPTPSSTILGKLLGKFNPTPSGTGALLFSLEALPAPADMDVYIVNASTGQTFTFDTGTTPYALTIQLWSPGT